MSFSVTFWIFSKRERSTALPSGTSTSYNCVANDTLDVLAPILTVQAPLTTATLVNYTYAHISSFGRYYFVDNWTVDNGLWVAHLRVDPWASWRSQIGAYSTYIYRCSYTYNQNVIDTMYPRKTVGGCSEIQVLSPWLTYLTNVVGVVSNNGVQYYMMADYDLSYFLSVIFSDSYASAMLNNYDISLYPEAKIAINPLQYVTTVHKLPILPPTNGAAVNTINVGGVNISIPGNITTINRIIDDGYRYVLRTIPKSDYPTHPQANSRGNWLNVTDMQYTLHIPPFGSIDIPSDTMWAADAIGYKLEFDARTGDAILKIFARFNVTDIVMHTMHTNIAIPFPLTHIYNPGKSDIYSYTNDNLGGNILQAWQDIKTAMGGIESIGQEIIKRGRHLNMIGSVGSSASYKGVCYLEGSYKLYVDDDNDENGRPLCEVKQISNIPGFVQCCPDKLAIPATQPELNELRNGMKEGFVYA